MPVVIINGSAEKYQTIAKYSTDPHQLTGRTSKTVTEQRVSYVCSNLKPYITIDDTIFDVGCGDGSFTIALSQFSSKVVAICPSAEELDLLQNTVFCDKLNVKLAQGLTDNLLEPMSFGPPNIILCNNVLHGNGFTEQSALDALAHFSFSQQVGAILYLGEIPVNNEFEGRNYGHSFAKYLFWLATNRGLRATLKNLVQYAFASTTNRVYTLQNEDSFWALPETIVNFASQYGYELLSAWNSGNNAQVTLPTDLTRGRIDYLFRKQR